MICSSDSDGQMDGRPNAAQSKFVMKLAFSNKRGISRREKIEVESNARPVIGQITGKGGKIIDII